MRKPLLFLLILASPLTALAASIELRPLSGTGAAKLMTVSAELPPHENALYHQVDTQFRASYYFALAELASADGHALEASILLKRACDADPGSSLLLREQGDALEAAGKEGLAVEVLQQALAMEPKNLDLRQQIARLHMRAGHKELAQALFLNADGSDPEDPAWLRALIGIDVSTDALAQAEKRLRRLLAGPEALSAGSGQANFADERELLALTLQRQERWEEAAAEFRALLKLDKTRSSAWARLAACEDAQGNSIASMQALSDGLQAQPDSILLEDQQAKAYYRHERFKDAEEAFGRLLVADPKDTQSLLYRGLARLKQKNFAQAQDDFSALGQLEKDSPSQLYGLGLAQLWQGKQAEAEKSFKQVLALNAQAVPAYTQLAFLYDRQGKTDKAVELLKRGHKEAPHSPELALLLGAAYMDQKDYAAAEAVYQDAMGQGEEKAVIRFQLAVLYDKWDKFPKAEAVLKELLVDEPKNAQALNYLGYSWVERKGDLKEAEALIRRALAVDPGNAFYQDSLGWSLYRQGRNAEAAEALQAASDKVLRGTEQDADEAVVLEHLAEVRTALGQLQASEEAKLAAKRLREKAQAKSKELPDPSKEPDL